MPNPKHAPTGEQRKQVTSMCACGISQESIARVIGIAPKTLRNSYREELDTAVANANTQVVQTLFEKAVGGDTTAMIWWTKGRMGWSEKRDVEVNMPTVRRVTKRFDGEDG